MIQLEILPDFVVFQILQKLEFRTWIRSRRTGSFIFNFVQEHSYRFNFESPLQEVCISFGNCINYDFDIIALTADRETITFTDPAVSLAGLNFSELRIEESSEKPDFQSDEDFKKYLAVEDSIFNDKALPAVKILKNRAVSVIIGIRKIYLMKMIEICGASKIEMDYTDIENEDDDSWVEWTKKPELKAVTHITLGGLRNFRMIPAFLSRFEYFYGEFWHEHTKSENLQDAVNFILKDLTRDLSNQRTLILCSVLYDSQIYEEGRELRGIFHRVLFNGHSFSQTESENATVKVVLISQRMFFGLMFICLRQDTLDYYIDVSPIVDHKRIALCLMETVLTTYPVDMSVLLEKLQNQDDIGDALQDFMAQFLPLSSF